MRIQIKTLVDITPSGVQMIRDNNTKEYHQQQNFNMLVQIIGLRAQPFDLEVSSKIESIDDFAAEHTADSATVWTLTFTSNVESVWATEDNELGLLGTDIHGVAIASNLDEDVIFVADMFDTCKNINTIVHIA